MALYPRLLGMEQPGIHVHQFWASLGELQRGKLTIAQIITLFNLSPSEQTEAQTLFARLATSREAVSFGMSPAGVTLTNVGATYDATTASQNLGFARVELAGISSVIFDVRANKVGGGTQSYQLWNETDGNEVAVIDDAGATGLKFLSVTKAFAQPLAAGLKICRVRVKSTTAADDPVYFGAALSLERKDILSSFEGHEIGMLSEEPGSPYYHNDAALQARLLGT